MSSSTLSTSMDTLALIRVEVLRLARDLKSVVLIAAVFVLPFLAALAGGSIVKVQMLTALFLPLAVAWTWGGDLSRGRLIQLVVSRYSAAGLLLARIVVFTAVVFVAVIAVAIAGRASLEDASVLLPFTLHITLLGFFLSTTLRSAEVGWIPLFAAFGGVWLPMLLIMKRTGGAMPQRWLHWLTAALLPQFATELGFYSARQLVVIHTCLIALWSVLALMAVQRAEALDRKGDD